MKALNYQTKFHNINSDEIIDNIYAALEANINQIFHLIKTSSKKKSLIKNSIYKKPWYLLIGPLDSGKSTLIENSNLLFTHTLSQEGIDCKTWITENEILINIPGELVSNSESIDAWGKLIQLLNKLRPKRPLDGIILVLNLNQTLQQPKVLREKINLHLQNILFILSTKLSSITPTYVFLTHMDTLAGFKQYFGELSEEELEEPWGFNLEITDDVIKLQKNFLKEFKIMLDRLNDRILWRLQQTYHKEDISSIYEFPLQFETLEKHLLYQFKQIFTSSILEKIKPLGIFFTSSCQQGNFIDNLSKHTNSILSTQALSIPFFKKNNLVYFTQKIIRKIVTSDPKINIGLSEPLVKKKTRVNYLSLTFLIVLSVFSIFYFGNHFNHDLTTIQKANKHLFKAQVQIAHLSKTTIEPTSLSTILQELKLADDSLKDVTVAKIFTMFSSNFKELTTQVKTLYNQSVKHLLLPFIRNQLYQQLNNNLEINNPYHLYHLLKAYLMFEQEKFFDSEYLTTYVLRALRNNPYIQTSDINNLTSHIAQVLKKPTNLSIDQHIVKTAREQFTKHPPIHLAYLIFKSSVSNHYSTSQTVSTNLVIPSLFLIENFSENYLKFIPKICHKIFVDRWVLGDKPYHYLYEPNENEFIESVRKTYLQEYKQWWQQFIYQFLPTTDLYSMQDILSVLTLLNDSSSNFQTALNYLESNTKFLENDQPAYDIFNKEIATTFQKLNWKLYSNKSSFELIVKELQGFYQNLAKSENMALQSFNMVSEAFNLPDKQNIFLNLISENAKSSDFIDKWLYQLGLSLWKFHIQLAEKYISSIWQKKILPIYQNNILDHYPINKNSEKEIKLTQFADYFSPNGLLADFFEQYIKPFIDIRHPQWKPISLYGVHLNFQPEVATHFIRTQLIQNMFFISNKLAFSFLLKPLDLQPIVKSISLNINGQKLLTTHHNKNSTQITWPGNKKTKLVQLVFESIEGKKVALLKNSEWAWFKLLDQANIKPAGQNTYQLLVNLDGNAAVYELITSNAINPFIEGIVEYYKAPDTLFLSEKS